MIARLWLQADKSSRFYFSKKYSKYGLQNQTSEKPLFSTGKNNKKTDESNDQPQNNPTTNFNTPHYDSNTNESQQIDSTKQQSSQQKSQIPKAKPKWLKQKSTGQKKFAENRSRQNQFSKNQSSPTNEYSKNESLRNESPRNESPRNESPRNESPRNESPRNESPRNESSPKRRLFNREITSTTKKETQKDNSLDLYGYDGKNKDSFVNKSQRELSQRAERRAIRKKTLAAYLETQQKGVSQIVFEDKVQPKLTDSSILQLVQAKLEAVGNKKETHEARVIQMIANDEIQALLLDLKECKKNNFKPVIPPSSLDQLFSNFPTQQSFTLMSNLPSRLHIVNEYLAYYAGQKIDDIPINYPPVWILHASQYLQKHPSKQSFLLLRNILNLMLSMPDHYCVSILYTTQTVIGTICNLYFRDQQALPEFLKLAHQAVMETEGQLKVFELFANEFQMYWIKHRIYPFTVTLEIIQLYETSFKEPNICLTLMYALIACYSGYPDVYDHFLKNQKEFSDVQLMAMQPICHLLTINRKDYHSSISKPPLNIGATDYEDVFSRVCVSIKNNQLQQAYNQFLELVLIPQAIPKMRQVVESVMMQYLIQQSNKQTKFPQYFYPEVRSSFLNSIDDNFFIDIYVRSLDFAVDNYPYLPEDHFSYWDTICKKERTQELIKAKAKGLLNEMIQKHPEKYSYNLQQWIKKIPINLAPYHQDYEVEKQLIKYRNYVKALLLEAPTRQSVYLNKLLRQAQIGLSERAKQILKQFCLYQYNFLTTEMMQPLVRNKELKTAMRYTSYSEFIAKFNIMLMYNCKAKKMFVRKNQIEINDEENKSSIPWTDTLLQQIYFNQRELFQNAERVCKITPNPLVDRLIQWGLYNEEPMGIYLGEKLAMITNQHVSTKLALEVSNFLSLRRILPEGRVQLCKRSLQIVGKIDREQIYDVYHDYHHILQRKHYEKYAQQKNKEVYHSAAISYMMKFIPEQRLQQKQPAYYYESAKKGPIRID